MNFEVHRPFSTVIYRTNNNFEMFKLNFTTSQVTMMTIATNERYDNSLVLKSSKATRLQDHSC